MPREKSYPFIGIDEGGMAVLFTAYREGVLVVDPSGEPSRVGYYSSGWSEDNFHYYNGEITLKNG